MMYNTKTQLYTLSVNHVSVMDGWIAKEYESRLLSSHPLPTESEPGLKNLWAYKQMGSIKPIRENPVENIPDVEKSYEEELLKYSVVVGGYVPEEPEIVGGDVHKKILVF